MRSGGRERCKYMYSENDKLIMRRNVYSYTMQIQDGVKQFLTAAYQVTIAHQHQFSPRDASLWTALVKC